MHTRRHFLKTVILGATAATGCRREPPAPSATPPAEATVSSFDGALTAARRAAAQARKLLSA